MGARMRIAAILVAAGTGSRLGAETPKQFCRIAGQPVIRHAVARPGAACRPDPAGGRRGGDRRRRWPAWRICRAVPGGATRQDSVRAGLEALAPHAPEVVLVHDAARPYVPPGTVAALLAALEQRAGRHPGGAGGRHAEARRRGRDDRRDGAARRAVPRADPAGVSPSRCCWRCTAPRRPGATDDAAILEQAGHAVALVAGDEDNIKLTYKEDLVRLERVLPAR